MNTYLLLPVALLGVALANGSRADDAMPSQHQLVKECMVKQKEADSGKPKDEMRAFCKDWAKTQKDAEKQQAPAKD